jgi:hypothetical protein
LVWQGLLHELRLIFVPKNERNVRKMPRLFMYGTELQEMEQLMILVPRFSPRQKGLIVVGETKDVTLRMQG